MNINIYETVIYTKNSAFRRNKNKPNIYPQYELACFGIYPEFIIAQYFAMYELIKKHGNRWEICYNMGGEGRSRRFSLWKKWRARRFKDTKDAALAAFSNRPKLKEKVC